MFVFYLPLSSSWIPEDSLLLEHISPQRREKVLRYRRIPDRRLSLYAALTVRMGLSRLSGLPASQLAFDCPSGKKPVCLTLPSWDFSLSHTEGAILCCIAGCQEEGNVRCEKVGCDIEGLAPAPLEIMPRIFHPEEIAYIQKGSPADQNQRFFQLWTRKEAYVKQLGTGLTDDLNRLYLLNGLTTESTSNLLIESTTKPTIKILTESTAEPLSTFLHTWQEDHYICTVASSRPCDKPQVRRLREEDLWKSLK
jgi:4'-phosphopantetheinyl transferase